MKKLLFIYHAKSGTAGIARHLCEVIDIFIKSGYYVDAYQTQSPLDAKRQIVQRAKDFDMVVCSGGDGTLNEAVSGIMMLDNPPLLGYIPSGSTNDFAGSIGLKKNMVTNAKIAVGGSKYKVDVGTFNGNKNFVYVVAFGLFTEVSYSTSQGLKNVIGHQAYILEAIKSLPSIKAYKMRFEFDGKVIEDEFVYGMISNSRSVGGIKGLMGDDVVLDDGLYEVTLIKKPKKIQDLSGIVQAVINTKAKSEYIYRFKVSEIKVSSDEPVKWTVDGECGGEHKSVYVTNIPNAVTIMGAKRKIVAKEKE
ncbi:MAG: YegS/Rv2252/BmrU family lipid kinase [Lachnospiraceae bacterium]|nr:YegS/Rv2252/BmrU family lipid kinase [Lachnospiraceae bacterium]